MQSQSSSEEKPSLENIKKKIIVLSGKGGVGKTTVSTNLAVGLAFKGLKIGLLDIDIHGPNVPKMLGLDGLRPSLIEDKLCPVFFENKLKVVSIGFLLPSEDQPVVWRGPLKHKALKEFVYNTEWGELDCLVIDSPPGTGDEILSIIHILNKLDGAIIVATPQKVALSDIRKTITFCKDVNIPILGIIENMSGFVCPKCGTTWEIFPTGGAEKIAKELKIPFLGKIPIDPQVSKGSDEGKPIVLNYPDSAPGKAFKEIIEKIKDKLKL
ncbi:MAG: ATP-binding protein [Thermodesulfobacteriota bacterium]|nr:MAG: ATP-binding protein [Thermodesulfobacteriota bacterium]RLG12882.1 MAG: ATP-binding protein [Candidatus Pacearchaeota archaeon]